MSLSTLLLFHDKVPSAPASKRSVAIEHSSPPASRLAPARRSGRPAPPRPSHPVRKAPTLPMAATSSVSMIAGQPARALYDFDPSGYDGALRLKAGNVVMVTNAVVGEAWWTATHGQQRGIVPSDYIELVTPKDDTVCSKWVWLTADGRDQPGHAHRPIPSRRRAVALRDDGDGWVGQLCCPGDACLGHTRCLR